MRTSTEILQKLDPAVLDLFGEFANAQGLMLDEWVVEACREKALVSLGMGSTTTLSDVERDRFLELVENPPNLPPAMLRALKPYVAHG